MLNRLAPFLNWFEGYSLRSLGADFFAGLTVALVLIPQSMAYAQLAGLPPYYGLYAAFAPPLVAALFGSSRQLATGPVTIVSLMTASALEPLAASGSPGFIAYAVFLALMVGVIQFFLGVLRMGLIVNFLSHPVVTGFVNAAALICILSQLPKLFGIVAEKGARQYETVYNTLIAIPTQTHLPTLCFALAALLLMIGLRKLSPKIPYVLAAVVLTTFFSEYLNFENNRHVSLERIGSEEVRLRVHEFNTTLKKINEKLDEKIKLQDTLRQAEAKYGEAHAISLENKHLIALVELELTEEKERVGRLREGLRRYRFQEKQDEFLSRQTGHWRIKIGNHPLDEERVLMMGGGAVVGAIPEGLPEFSLPKSGFEHFFELLPMAVVIALLGLMQAISSAKALATKTGHRLDANQELIGQGLANMAGSMAQSYPVSGSFSRSAVNLQAGARTGLSSVITSGVVVVVLLFFTPLLHHLPQSVLAAIIILAVTSLIDIRVFIRAIQVDTFDGLIGVVTFVCTLIFAPFLEIGILIGVALTLFLFIFKHMRPQIAHLSKYTDGTFRNAELYGLEVCKHIALVRFNSSLFFVNVNHLEDKILELVSALPHLKHIVVVGNGINQLDASGEETLYKLVRRLKGAGFEISFSGLNDQVRDTIGRTGLFKKITKGHLFRNVAMTLEAIHEKYHQPMDEDPCPLMEVCFKGLPTYPGFKKNARIVEGPDEKEDK